MLENELDALHNGASGASSSTWGDVLKNGGNPGMDVNFGGYDALGLEDVTAAGTLTGDSLVLNKDASITGRLNVTSIATMSDSLKVSGFVEFGDSLQVVKAVTIGETLYVTGVTSLGDSLHVAGNVDFDALLNVDGAATFGSTLTVSGETTLNDSLHVNSGANITGTLYADSVSVADVIDGQVSSLGNHDTDDLAEGSTNLYLTSTERDAIAAMAYAIDSLSCTWMKHQGVVYELILIGDQCWFAENLRSENYADGTPIPGSLTDADWTSTTSGAQTVYDNNDENLAIYGRLYNWYAVDDARGLCPGGWHVPTDEEWTTLTTELGGESVAGDQMKSSSSDSPAWDGSNSSGFSALPGGLRNTSNGYFYFVGVDGYWWSASPSGASSAWYRSLGSGYVDVGRYSIGDTRNGFSVRCVRD